MSKNEQDVSATIVLQALEGAVKWLQDKGEDNTEIHKLVELIIQGHIVGGKYTDEYVMYAARAGEQKKGDNDKPSLLFL